MTNGWLMRCGATLEQLAHSSRSLSEGVLSRSCLAMRDSILPLRRRMRRSGKFGSVSVPCSAGLISPHRSDWHTLSERNT